MKIHHVGYLTKNLEKSRKQFEKLGYETEQEVSFDEIREINIEFMVNDGYRVELIEPVSKDSPMYPLLKHYKNTPYHFCYSVENLEEAIEKLTEERYVVIDKPERAPCIEGRRVSFLMHKDMGIIELVED
jgi:methylmalonyl-CoA/ethylmalonyl-CoA epimerase